MSTVDLISGAALVADRPAWAPKGAPDVLGLRIDAGQIEPAAQALDHFAAQRGAKVVEVCRVDRGGLEVIFARLEKV